MDPQRNEKFVLLLVGAMRGISIWTIALPFDTIKSLIMSMEGHKNTGINIPLFNAFVERDRKTNTKIL